jgi:hypothetical protein
MSRSSERRETSFVKREAQEVGVKRPMRCGSGVKREASDEMRKRCEA